MAETQLFMCQRCQGNAGSWLWLFTPDVDRLHAELRGVREMQVVDPDGNVLRIASPLAK